MRIVVDADVCQGHLRCYGIAPDLFEIDEQGHAMSPDRDIAEGPELDLAWSAVENCPERAIRIED